MTTTKTASILILSLLPIATAEGLFAEDEAREIWDTKFRSKRQPATTAPRPPKAIRYTPSTVVTELQTKVEPQVWDKPVRDAQIGVTIWKRKSPGNTDREAARLLVFEELNHQAAEYVFERLSPGESLKRNDGVRVSIEVPQEGYLYVLNRERYRGGGHSDCFLIFPSLRPQASDNHVRPGRLIDIPRQDEAVPVLRVTPTANDYAGEELLIIFSPSPIPEIAVGAKPVKIAPELVDRWERLGASIAQRWDLVDGVGGLWTKAEKEAAVSGARLLTQDDPMPQSIFSGQSAGGQPVIVHVRLDVK